MTLDEMVVAAQKRLLEWINKSCAQHIRRMKEGYGKNI